MGRKPIIIVIGILLIFLALAEPGSAKAGYAATAGVNCSFCHVDPNNPDTPDYTLTDNGLYFRSIHKFNGIAVPTSAANCTTCHTDLNLFLPLTLTGQNYSDSHRYNETTLASARLPRPGCFNCHVNVNANNFAFLTGTPAYNTSAYCVNCHKSKYDNWTATMHRVMLTNNSTALAMGLPTPDGFSWENMTYVIVGKPELRYLNESGYLFKRYFAENETFADYGPRQYTCGGCHTTGYNATGGNQSGLPGIVGTWAEPGIACERCHGPGGNGHQVEANVSEQVCLQCHNGSTRQGTFLSSAHSPPLEAPTSCLRCHSPFDYAENRTVTSATAINVVCANCHNSHNTSDDQYKDLFSPGGFDNTTYADVKDAKNGLFNATATRALRAAGETVKDIYDILMTPASITEGIDESYTGPISVTGPISEVLCSNCHYNHGLSHIGEVKLSHGRKFGPLEGIENATCIDCHMATSQKNHSFNVKDENNFPSKTCSRGTECHVTSAQNLNESAFSVVPVVNEWRSSAHNNSAWGEDYNRSSCAECHSPINWNPLNASERIEPENYKGVTCAICHNIHDMGDWLTKTELLFGIAKPYAWYDRDALNRTTHYRANYSIEETTTGLCTNCHRNRPDTSIPSPTGGRGPHGFVVPHISPQKEMYLGSVKDSGTFMFECATCHMYSKTIDPTNLTEKVLPDNQKVKGHTFRVNETGLQSDGSWNNLACSVCHVEGGALGSVEEKINSVQADIQTKWNATNDTVENAYAIVNASTKDKTLAMNKLAEAFFKLYLVKNDGSWGVHDPQKANDLLNDSTNLANEALAALEITLSITSFDPDSPVMNNVSESRTFSITVNQTVNVTWYINGSVVQDTEKGVTSASYTNTSAVLGTWNVSAIADNENGTVMQTWEWDVGVIPPATFNISGFKLNDEGDMGISDWKIMLIDVITGLEIENTTTDSTGAYNFTGLLNGTYNVTEEMKSGWMNVSPMSLILTINGMDLMNENFTNTVVTEEPLIITSFNPPIPVVSDNVGDTRTFNITVNQTADVTWYLNGAAVSSDLGVTTSSYTNTSAALGTWNLSAAASNENGTDMQIWNWVVTAIPPVGAPHITSFDPPTPVMNNVSDPRTFSITVNQTVNVTWYVNGSVVKDTDKGVTAASYTNASAVEGTWNVTAIASNTNGTDSTMWKWIVTKVVVKPNSISGYVINDLNSNGMQDANETGLPGWSINLIGLGGTALGVNKVTTTDAQGFYIFENLPPGNYMVLETLQGGYIMTAATVKVAMLEDGKNAVVNFTNRPILSLFPSINWWW